MRTKIGTISRAINSCAYDVILLVESWLHGDIIDSEFCLTDFNIFRNDRDSDLTGLERGGGLFIAIRKSLKATHITLENSVLEQLFVMATINSKKYIFGAIYIPPSSNSETYSAHCTQLLRLCERFPNCELVIVGDFNLPDATWFVSDSNTIEVQCAVRSSATIIAENYNFLNLLQTNRVPNRFGTFLDLVFVKEEVAVREALDPLTNVVDRHLAYEFSLISQDSDKIVTDIYYYDFKSCDINAINNALASANWHPVFCNNSDVNMALNVFYDIIYNVVETFVPVKRFKSSTFPVWFSGELKNLIIQKKIAHAQFKRTESPEDYTIFSDYRDQCKILRDICYNQYIERVDANLTLDPSQFWKHLNNVRQSSGYPKAMFLDETSKDTVEGIVNLFANNFSKIYTDENHTVPDYNFPETVDLPVIGLSLVDVFDGINNMKSTCSYGPDGVPSYLLKACVCTLSRPLLHLFSLSLKTGVFPDYWKTSFITPIFKAGNRADIQNYRGVSICSAIPKLFDSLVCNVLAAACKHFIIPEQHGFAQGKSTTTNLLVYENYLLNALENRLQVDSIYTDFSKAFDKVSHKMLVAKLGALGFGDIVVAWFASFLKDRFQFVRINNVLSVEIRVASGVPQGSHCAPLLFSLFINDIGNAIVNSEFLLFADDLKLFRRVSEPSDCILIQDDLDRLSVWCQVNGLQLNIDKCFSITFSRKAEPITNIYVLNDQTLTIKCSIKDLGVILDSKLNFQEHYIRVVNRAARMLGLVTRNSADLSLNSLKLLYCSLVRSTLEYASVVWSPYHQVHIAALEGVQKKFLRIVAWRFDIDVHTDAQNPYYINYEPVLNRLAVHTLESRRAQSSICFLYKLLMGSINCDHLLSLINFSTTRRTRNNELFYIPTNSTNYAMHNPLTRMCRLYNEYDLDPFKFKFYQFKKHISRII